MITQLLNCSNQQKIFWIQFTMSNLRRRRKSRATKLPASFALLALAIWRTAMRPAATGSNPRLVQVCMGWLFKPSVIICFFPGILFWNQALLCHIYGGAGKLHSLFGCFLLWTRSRTYKRWRSRSWPSRLSWNFFPNCRPIQRSEESVVAGRTGGHAQINSIL